MINALTIDVEDYFHVQAFADVISPTDWHRYSLRVEKNTYHILEMLAARKIHATFFILGWVAQRCAALVAEISKSGHEIGSHGYAHQMIRRGRQKDFRDDILRSKSILEDQLGAVVKSYRAPSYSITSSTLWALEILAEAGYECDSSIFPIHHDSYGIPKAPRFPHFQTLRSGARILEFPPSTIEAWGVNFPVAGGGYFRLLPYSLTAWAIRRINKKEKQPALLYFHPWEIDPEQPRIVAPWRSRFRHYQNLHSTEEKLTRLFDDFSWAPMSKVLSSSLGGANSKDEVANGL